MRINDGSKCSGCNLFDHECEVPCGDDYCCFEYCSSCDSLVRENFYDREDAIIECKSFVE